MKTSIYSLTVTYTLAAALSAAELPAVLVAEPPAFGTFYSLTLRQPPYPFNPFPELPVYSTGTGAFIYDDSTVDYPLLWAAQAVIQAALETGGGEMMTMSEPPPNPCPTCPPCTNCPPITNPPPYNLPGLKLTIPFLTNGAVYNSTASLKSSRPTPSKALRPTLACDSRDW